MARRRRGRTRLGRSLAGGAPRSGSRLTPWSPLTPAFLRASRRARARARVNGTPPTRTNAPRSLACGRRSEIGEQAHAVVAAHAGLLARLEESAGTSAGEWHAADEDERASVARLREALRDRGAGSRRGRRSRRPSCAPRGERGHERG